MFFTSFRLYKWLTNHGKHHYIPDKQTSRTVKTDQAQSEAGDSKYFKKNTTARIPENVGDFVKNCCILTQLIFYLF